MPGSLLTWSAAEAARFGREPLKAGHRLHESALFADEALVELLDRMPPDRLHAYTMGDDPGDHSQWRAVRYPGVSGRDLVEAVRRGRLWLNLLRVQDSDHRYGLLAGRAYEELADLVPGFAPTSISATVLISSPGAMVHYHADGQPNLLWHLRGRKQVLVYPALDPRFLSTGDLQRIFAGESDEFVPYRRSWDDHAAVLDLAPGEVASWPQNAPHRVVNTVGLNVSLSTEHHTRASARREHVWAANLLLSRQFHLSVSSTKESGPWAAAKATCYRVLRRLSGPPMPTPASTVVLRIDDTAPLGHTLTSG
ncbi:MAG: hypothetical protein V7637_3960 [Mycobacteriales bacterium]